MQRCKNRVEQDQTIRTGVPASVIAHLSLLALLVFLSEVRPLGSATEPVAVNIVMPDEVEPQQVRPEQKPAFEPAEPERVVLPETPVPEQPVLPATPASKSARPSSPQRASPDVSQPDRRAAAASPPAQFGSKASGYRQPEPDLSVKYNVLLGLPAELPPPPKAETGASEEGFDATTSTADISSSVIAEFRRYLKTCSRLPASIQPADRVMVKLRVLMTQDGRLAADPVVGGGSANIKAIDLLQSAIAGLKQCQPYKMLPADRYGEWRVLDLDFTPRDFQG